ncbi:hypothetical protein FRB90_011319, partial [Tulasnella sp. 427]
MSEAKSLSVPTLSEQQTLINVLPSQEEDSMLWESEKTKYQDIPYKEFVSVLGLPCTIGTAIAASAAFATLTANSLLGDTSPEAFATLWHKTMLLKWSAGCYAIATAIVVCLQCLYSSPAFCRTVTKGVYDTAELRRLKEPLDTWDILRCIVAYAAIAAACFSVLLQLGGTILLMEAVQRSLLSEVTIGSEEKRDSWCIIASAAHPEDNGETLR